MILHLKRLLIVGIFLIGFFFVGNNTAHAGFGEWGGYGQTSGVIQIVPNGYALTAIGYGSDDKKCIMQLWTAPVSADGSVDFSRKVGQYNPCSGGIPDTDKSSYRKYFNPTDGEVATGWTWGANTSGGMVGDDGYPPDECFYQEYMNLATKQFYGWSASYDGTCNERGYPSDQLKNIARAPAGSVIIGIEFNLDDDAKLEYLAWSTRTVAITPVQQSKTAEMSVRNSAGTPISDIDLNPTNKTFSGKIANVNSTNGGSFVVTCSYDGNEELVESLTVSCPSTVVPPNAEVQVPIEVHSPTDPGEYTATISIDAAGVNGTSVTNGSQDVTVTYTVPEPPPGDGKVDVKCNGINGPCIIPQGSDATVSWGPLPGYPNYSNCTLTEDQGGTTISHPNTGSLITPTNNLTDYTIYTYTMTCQTPSGGTTVDAISLNYVGVSGTCQLKANALTGTVSIVVGESVNWTITSANPGYPYFWHVSGAATSNDIPGTGNGLTPGSEQYIYNTAGTYVAYVHVQNGATHTDCTTNTVTLVVEADTDGDGVGNGSELCPGTPPNTPVDANGCPTTLPPPGSLPNLDFRINGNDSNFNVPINTPLAIEWTTQNVVSCTASGNPSWSGSKPLSGTASSNSGTSNITFTMHCNGSGSGGSINRSITVGVGGAVSLSAQPRYGWVPLSSTLTATIGDSNLHDSKFQCNQPTPLTGNTGYWPSSGGLSWQASPHVKSSACIYNSVGNYTPRVEIYSGDHTTASYDNPNNWQQSTAAVSVLPPITYSTSCSASTYQMTLNWPSIPGATAYQVSGGGVGVLTTTGGTSYTGPAYNFLIDAYSGAPYTYNGPTFLARSGVAPFYFTVIPSGWCVGDIMVNATLNGNPWSGNLKFSLIGPSTAESGASNVAVPTDPDPDTVVGWFCGPDPAGIDPVSGEYYYDCTDGSTSYEAVPITNPSPKYPDLQQGSWTLNYLSGGPAAYLGTFPQKTQSIPGLSPTKPSLAFTLRFTSDLTDGICGTASKTYLPGATSYGSDTYCSSGVPSASPAFPEPGTSASWTCNGVNGGTNSGLCSAIVPNDEFSITIIHANGGTIKSTDNAINCGDICTASYEENDEVTLVATPVSTLWKFVGWTGACEDSGATPSCTITVDAPKTIGAIFGPQGFNYQEF
jgi:hypothetical protein